MCCGSKLSDTNSGPLHYSLNLTVQITVQRPGGLLQDLAHRVDASTHLSRLLRELTVLARKGQRSPSGYSPLYIRWGKFKSRKRADPKSGPAPARRGGARVSGKQAGGVTRGDARRRGALPHPPARLGYRRPGCPPCGRRGGGRGAARARGPAPLVGARAVAPAPGGGAGEPGSRCVTAHSPRLRFPPRRVWSRFSCGRWVWGVGTCPLSHPRRNPDVSLQPPPTVHALSPLLVKGNSSGVC